MSISLHVEEYCQNCPKFEPDLKTTALIDGQVHIYCHDIYCVNRAECKNIANYLTKSPLLHKKFNIPTDKKED